MIAISAIFFLLTILFSYLQEKYLCIPVFAIINNIVICIFTGSLIALLQFIIGYHNAKHDQLLSFYRSIILLEEKIVYYPYQHLGFVDAVSGLKDIREILNFYSESVISAYKQIDFDGHCDKALISAQTLFTLYKDQIEPFKKFRDTLCDGIRFMDKTEVDLICEGVIDIPDATRKMNELLQEKEKAVQDAYNDENARKKRNEAYEILENYLFGKSSKQKKSK
jgi:hypothetical protein